MPDHSIERLAHAIRDHADVVKAHDTVHPDRSDCGGVGNCSLMRTEVETEREVISLLEHVARRHPGKTLALSLVRR